MYGSHMPANHQKTTVYLDPTEYSRLKGLANRRGCAPASLVREAVAEYVTRHAPRAWPTSIASAASGPADLAGKADAYLAGMGATDSRPKPARKRPSPSSKTAAKRRRGR